MNLRVAVIGKRPRFDLSLLAPAKDAKLENAVKEKRKIFINKDWVEVTVFNRLETQPAYHIMTDAFIDSGHRQIKDDAHLVQEVCLLDVWHNEHLAISAILRGASHCRFDITDSKT